MNCSRCGYVMEPLETNCPRCFENAEKAVKLQEQQKLLSQTAGVSATGTTTLPRSSYTRTTAAQERRDKIADNMATAAWVDLILNVIIGAFIIISGLQELSDDTIPHASSPMTLIVTGIFIIGWGTFLKMVLDWGAELLRTIGRIEDKLPDDS